MRRVMIDCNWSWGQMSNLIQIEVDQVDYQLQLNL